jgi:hypothetical protein
LSWIRFGEPTQREGQKTLRWLVTTADARAVLGTVAWYSRWRGYAFYPTPSIFEEDCLREIADFCEARTREHRAARKERP